MPRFHNYITLCDSYLTRLSFYESTQNLIRPCQATSEHDQVPVDYFVNKNVVPRLHAMVAGCDAVPTSPMILLGCEQIDYAPINAKPHPPSTG